MGIGVAPAAEAANDHVLSSEIKRRLTAPSGFSSDLPFISIIWVKNPNFLEPQVSHLKKIVNN